jgi:uncharacterized protein
MKERVQHAIFIFLAIGALASVLLLRMQKQATLPLETVVSDAVLRSDKAQIPVTIADTDIQREQGLSGIRVLPENMGKLFVFERSGKYGFWMKDMHFDLDIIWLDEHLNIVDITPNITPNTYPNVFYPAADAMYVLETNAGFAQKHGLSIGDVFTLEE